MRRGEIYLIAFDPVRGPESNKTRPGVIVSNEAANRVADRTGRGVVTVVPVTSNMSRIFPFQVELRAAECGLAIGSKAQAEQVRAVAVERLGRRVGRLPAGVLSQLDDALRTHLAL